MNRWGCRSVTVAGALLSAVCVVASAYANNVITLIVTIGVGTGLGFGLIYLPAIVSVTVWFERYRSLATGKQPFYFEFQVNPVKQNTQLLSKYC